MSDTPDPLTGLRRRPIHDDSRDHAGGAPGWLVASAGVAAALTVAIIVTATIRNLGHDEEPAVEQGDVIAALPEVERAEITVTRHTVSTPRGPVRTRPQREADPGPINLASLTRIEPRIDPRVAAQREQVREAQQLLAAMGYAPGAIDGFLGVRTQAALEAFAEANGESNVGISDSFLAALRLANEFGHRAVPRRDAPARTPAPVEANGAEDEVEAEEDEAEPVEVAEADEEDAPFETLFDSPDPFEYLDPGEEADEESLADAGGELEEVVDYGAVIDSQILLSSMGYSVPGIDGVASPELLATAEAFASERGFAFEALNDEFVDALQLAIADDHRAPAEVPEVPDEPAEEEPVEDVEEEPAESDEAPADVEEQADDEEPVAEDENPEPAPEEPVEDEPSED